MNSLVDAGAVEGRRIGPGDVVQAAVVSFFCDGKVMKPQTTPDSPAYATLPYRIVVAEGGYWTAEPALPREALIHFRIPETVGRSIIIFRPGIYRAMQSVESEDETRWRSASIAMASVSTVHSRMNLR